MDDHITCPHHGRADLELAALDGDRRRGLARAHSLKDARPAVGQDHKDRGGRCPPGEQAEPRRDPRSGDGKPEGVEAHRDEVADGQTGRPGEQPGPRRGQHAAVRDVEQRLGISFGIPANGPIPPASWMMDLLSTHSPQHLFFQKNFLPVNPRAGGKVELDNSLGIFDDLPPSLLKSNKRAKR